MLDLLGAQGMSSDESIPIPDSNGRAYTYLHSNWRADEVGIWLEDFDTVYLLDRADETDRRGAWPHLRRRDQTRKLSARSNPVDSLPLNAYKPDWLATRISDWVRSHLRPTEQPYAFSNDDAFLRFVIFASAYIISRLIYPVFRSVRARFRPNPSGSL